VDARADIACNLKAIFAKVSFVDFVIPFLLTAPVSDPHFLLITPVSDPHSLL